MMAEIGDTGSGYKSHVAGADHRNTHDNSLTSLNAEVQMFKHSIASHFNMRK
jgi:hypothetical protein